MPRELSEQDVEEFRGRLCAVAERQFAELGFEAVSLRSITAELGCSRMTPYRYFADKADIFAAVRTAAYARLAATQEKALLDGVDPATRLASLGSAYAAFALAEPDAYRLMFELGQPDPTGHPELREAEERAWAPLQTGIRNAVESGLLEGDVDVLAHTFWAGIHGVVSLQLAGKLAFGTTVDQLVGPMLSQLFRGIRRSLNPRAAKEMPMSSVESRTDRHWDVVVIGSGLGGLTSAARLARSGLRVLVLEQHVFAGGYAHHFLRKVRGTKIVYDFDVALHQTGDLLPGRPMHAILEELEVLPQLGLHRFDVAYRSRGPRHDLQVPAAADAYEAMLVECYPEQATGVHDLFQHLREIDAPGADGAPSPAALATLDLSLSQLLDQHVKDERIQSILATIWGYLGLVPSQVSAFLYARMWSSFHHGGCFYIRGGGQALSDAFVRVIESHRGRVLLRREVAHIATTDGRVTGVETARGERFDAPVVISNAPAPLTYHQLLDDPALGAAELERVDGLPIACSIHQAYVGIRGNAAKLGLADRGAFFTRTYDFEEEREAMEAGDFRRQGWMIGNHDLADPGHAPPGRSMLLAAVMADGRLWPADDEAAYRDRKAELEAYLVERLADAIPDVCERIEVIETGTPHTMERYSSNPLGSIYGYASTPAGHSVHRPEARSSVPGLYLAGAWTFPGPGFSGTMTSGHRTAGLVIEDFEGRGTRAG